MSNVAPGLCAKFLAVSVPMELPGETVPSLMTSPSIVPVPCRIAPGLTVVFDVILPLTASAPELTVVTPCVGASCRESN